MTQHMHHMTSTRSGADTRTRYSALQAAPAATQQVRECISAQIATGLPGGAPLSDLEIETVLAGISELEGLSIERFQAADYAIDDEPDAIAVCPTADQMAEIAAAGERDDLTPEEMIAHSRLLWNAIAYFQRRARDYDEAAKREAREREMLRTLRDDLRRQVDELAA